MTLFAVRCYLNRLSSIVVTFYHCFDQTPGKKWFKKKVELGLAHGARGWIFHRGGEGMSEGWEGTVAGTGGQLR